jgi:hypothetical protein
MAIALGGAYRRAQGRRPVTCPETNQSAFIQLDARHAALMHALGEPMQKLRDCSLWPERAGCGRGCQTLPSR